MSDPPKRTESTEMTLVCPRDSLAPVSMAVGPTIEQLADIERARRDAQDDVDTLVSCPGCESCPVCRGVHMVSAERSAEYKRQTSLEEDVPAFPADPDPPEAA